MDGPQDINTPRNLATGNAGSLWQWYEEPNNAWRFRRFMAAMKNFGQFPPSIYTESFDWKSLPPDGVVVDVGGGIGRITYELHKVFPHFKYVIQDLPAAVKDAKNVPPRRVCPLHAFTHYDSIQFWAEVAPKAVEDGRVSLQGDFRITVRT